MATLRTLRLNFSIEAARKRSRCSTAGAAKTISLDSFARETTRHSTNWWHGIGTASTRSPSTAPAVRTRREAWYARPSSPHSGPLAPAQAAHRAVGSTSTPFVRWSHVGQMAVTNIPARGSSHEGSSGDRGGIQDPQRRGGQPDESRGMKGDDINRPSEPRRPFDETNIGDKDRDDDDLRR